MVLACHLLLLPVITCGSLQRLALLVRWYDYWLELLRDGLRRGQKSAASAQGHIHWISTGLLLFLDKNDSAFGDGVLSGLVTGLRLLVGSIPPWHRFLGLALALLRLMCVNSWVHAPGKFPRRVDNTWSILDIDRLIMFVELIAWHSNRPLHDIVDEFNIINFRQAVFWAKAQPFLMWTIFEVAQLAGAFPTL